MRELNKYETLVQLTAGWGGDGNIYNVRCLVSVLTTCQSNAFHLIGRADILPSRIWRSNNTVQLPVFGSDCQRGRVSPKFLFIFIFFSFEHKQEVAFYHGFLSRLQSFAGDRRVVVML